MHISTRNKLEKKIINKLTDSGNEEIFFFWDQLSDEQKDVLINDISSIDLKKTYKFFKDHTNVDNRFSELSVPEIYQLENRTSKLMLSSIGAEAISKGEVAFLTVAGGQGTRLSFDHPKGCFPITPVKKKSLFRIFAEKIKFISQGKNTCIKWLIMTSESNHIETQSYFEDNGFFGLKKNNVFFFRQNMLPSLTIDGKLILTEKNLLYKNPDGHGGALKALIDTGLLKKLSDNGIKYLHYFQVDNPMAALYDTTFMGYHINGKYSITTKVIKKSGHLEKLGMPVKLKNGKNAVIEYSDLPESISGRLNENGQLKHSNGSIGIHIFNVNFLSRCTKKLPVHCAKKQIEAYCQANNKMERSIFECLKFEYFVFDVIPFAEKSAFYECERSEEFSPLKNKTDNDSIESCKNDQIKCHLSWLKDAGLLRNVTDLPGNIAVEISPLYAPDRNIFLEKAAKDSDNLKKNIFDNNGTLKNEIYIE